MKRAHCLRSPGVRTGQTALCGRPTRAMVMLMTPTQFHGMAQTGRCPKCHKEFQRLILSGKYYWHEGENGKREIHRR